MQEGGGDGVGVGEERWWRRSTAGEGLTWTCCSTGEEKRGRGEGSKEEREEEEIN